MRNCAYCSTSQPANALEPINSASIACKDMRACRSRQMAAHILSTIKGMIAARKDQVDEAQVLTGLRKMLEG